MSNLDGLQILVADRGSGRARAVTLRARVIVAGRDRQKLADAHRDEPDVEAETHDASIEAAASRLKGVDHVVSTVSARGGLRNLDPNAPRRSVDDVAEAVLFAMTNTFLTGVTLKVDGGEPLT
jgi:hypothetical protein